MLFFDFLIVFLSTSYALHMYYIYHVYIDVYIDVYII